MSFDSCFKFPFSFGKTSIISGNGAKENYPVERNCDLAML